MYDYCERLPYLPALRDRFSDEGTPVLLSIGSNAIETVFDFAVEPDVMPLYPFNEDYVAT